LPLYHLHHSAPIPLLHLQPKYTKAFSLPPLCDPVLGKLFQKQIISRRLNCKTSKQPHHKTKSAENMNQKPPKKNLQVSEVINLQVGGEVLAQSENQAPFYETHNAEKSNNSKIK
jgi:hypothetical protein